MQNLSSVTAALRGLSPDRRYGRVVAVRGALIEVEGLIGAASIGSRVSIAAAGGLIEAEVTGLLGLLKAFIRRDLGELHRQNVRIRVIGDRQNLQSDILPLLIEAEETTKANTALTLT